MHRLSAALLLLAACDVGGTVATESKVSVDEAISFGLVWAGEPAKTSFTVRANGSGPVTVHRVTTSLPDLSLSPGSGSLAPGAALRVEVVWTPKAAGALEALVRVETDVEGAETLEVRVTGESQAFPKCDDGNACTDDRFDRLSERCVFEPHERACDDGSACTTNDRCAFGACRGSAVRCDDDDVCTRDFCDPRVGCVHPPDERVCDDGDPCTANVCDRDRGCSFPNAPDGTACGELSCDTAHLCVFGTCRALDVSGSSDGFPCFDGDLCTKDDTCLAGECAPGPRVRSEPEIIASYETFGGEGSGVATDGTRFVFTDSDAVRIAVLGADGRLAHVSTLPLLSLVPPVNVAPGKFVVASGEELVLVDAGDPAAPRIVWRQPPWPMNGIQGDRDVLHLVTGSEGLVVALGSRHQQTTPISWVVSIPLLGPELALGREILLDETVRLSDLDAHGPLVVWTDARSTRLAELVPFGGTQAAAIRVVARRAQRLSLATPLLATSDAAGISVFDLNAPRPSLPTPCENEGTCVNVDGFCSEQHGPGEYVSCSDGYCPGDLVCDELFIEGCPDCDCDRICCSPTVQRLCVTPPLNEARHVAAPTSKDLVLERDLLAWTNAAGISGTLLSSDDEAVFAIDPLVVTRLDRGAGMLLASGPIALPLLTNAALGGEEERPDPVTTLRLTGPRHGDVSAIADGSGTRVALAGRVAVAELDLLEGGFPTWRLESRASSPSSPRVLRGTTRHALVESHVQRGATNVCEGSVLERVSTSGASDEIALCEHLGGHTEVAGRTVWALSAAENADASYGLKAWSLASSPTQPLLSLPDLPFASRVLRGADRGDTAALFTDLGDRLAIALHRTGDPAQPVTGSVEVGRARSGPLQRSEAAHDGNVVLVGLERRLGLYDAAGDIAVPRELIDLPDEARAEPTGVEWMAGGRAWVSWSTDEGPQLSEVHYASEGTLSHEGHLSLPGAPRRVFDTGLVTVATTDSGVSVIAPACR